MLVVVVGQIAKTSNFEVFSTFMQFSPHCIIYHCFPSGQKKYENNCILFEFKNGCLNMLKTDVYILNLIVYRLLNFLLHILIILIKHTHTQKKSYEKDLG